ncbi:hypothetical protein LSG25_01795 [Paralcaligenes sp. KSB-10]|uniref:hypothetical protein n=1 Tax=Paralcaligenes sp. KSB-10 TaxID=2901142 RepID=UPI001E435526|nr:hypothetical protein [Paralcaligenes sp. KSB-10]UHL64665.1 hypothetical protein LSG25_01795 [Paralcaligenes sp. KSB-10]
MQQSLDQEVSRFNVRKRSFQIFDETSSKQVGSVQRWLMRGQNFVVEWLEAGVAGETIFVKSEYETLVLMPDTGGTILRAGKPAILAAAGTVCVVPAGPYSIALEQWGRYCVIASSRIDIDLNDVLNAAAYSNPDSRIEPFGTPYRRHTDQGEVQVLQLDEISPPADNPRLKMVQTETLSINWVAYDGPRVRSQLSPHSHAHHEQGTLAISGNYNHHLRVEWGKDANLWQDDEHCVAPSPSLLVIPVNLIHTTEGIGQGKHILVDIFSPPRADFIAKGWVYNAGDYTRDK